MGALIALLPAILGFINSPLGQQLIPLLTQLGTTAFPAVDPAKATTAAADLFDASNTKWVQVALNVLGNKVDIDGVYGAGTKEAITAYQTKHGLTVDGWAGTNTVAALQKELLGK